MSQYDPMSQCNSEMPFVSNPCGLSEIYVCSFHPLGLHLIMDLLRREPAFQFPIRPLLMAAPDFMESKQAFKIVILDIYSIPEWEQTIRRWATFGLRPIVLAAEQSLDKKEHLRLLQSGIYGIVTMSEQVGRELALAVKAVIEGKLWVERDILEEYIRQSEAAVSCLPNGDKTFTDRERQVLPWLLREYTNRQIAKLLGISERTVKFHVHNILQKTNTETRQILARSAHNRVNDGDGGHAAKTEPQSPVGKRLSPFRSTPVRLGTG